MLYRVACAAMAVVFGFWVYYQYNDPDPWFWMSLYGVAGVCSLLAALRRLPFWLPAIVAALSLVLVVVWFADLVLTGTLGLAFVAFVEDAGEPAREMLGLAVIGAWTAYLAARTRRAARAAV